MEALEGLGDGTADGASGVVDQEIDATGLVEEASDELIDRLEVGEIDDTSRRGGRLTLAGTEAGSHWPGGHGHP